jgi:hypothetical protein
MSSDSELQARLREVEDRLAIIELEGAYCQRFDERDGEGWAQLFTKDGRYRSRGITSPAEGSYAEGRESLAAYCRDAPYTGIHLTHVPQLTIHGDTAEGRVHFEYVGTFAKSDSLSRSVGFYDVRYERVGGKWYFAEKITTAFASDNVIADGYPSTAAWRP